MRFWYRAPGLILKLIFGSIIVGSLVGLMVPFVLKLFSLDGVFELHELLFTVLIIIGSLVFFVLFLTNLLSRITTTRPLIDFNFIQFKFLSIPGILTCIIPMGGGLFGGTGNEPIWVFMLLGVVGSIFWSLPLVLWIIASSAYRWIKGHWLCPVCGGDNQEYAKFCKNCGASLSASRPIGVGVTSSEPAAGSFPKTIKRNHNRRIKPWIWIVSGIVGIIVIGGLVLLSGPCNEFALAEDWEQTSRGNSYAELGLYERAIHEYDEAIRLERNHAEAYYKRALAYESLGKTLESRLDFERAIRAYDEAIRMDPSSSAYNNRAMAHKALGMTIEAKRDFEKTIQAYDEVIRLWGEDSRAHYRRGLVYEALGKTLEAKRDFEKAKDLGYYSEDCPVTVLDDFTKKVKVTPLVLEGEISIDSRCQKWRFNGDEDQNLRFKARPNSGNHIDFEHVSISLSLVDSETLQTTSPRLTGEISEVIGQDEELREISLPETGTYTLWVEGNIDETSGAYVITISEQQP